MMYYSTLTSKGQMTLPADIRNQLNIVPGQRVAIQLNERGEAVIKPAVSLQMLRQKTYTALHERGITDDQVREMAHGYKNGDGMTVTLEEEYGQR